MSKDKRNKTEAFEKREQHGDKKKVAFTTNLEFQTALNVLQQTLESARDGNFVLDSNGEAMTLVPAADVELGIKAKDKAGEQSIKFELKWPASSAAQTGIPEEQRTAAEGDTCVTDLLRMNREATEREEAELERRFERELFGSCGCVEIPGPESEQRAH